MISIKGISKSFGSQRVLSDISLSINEGEMISIVGPSGVGKSVLLKLLIGVIRPDSGEILINGRSITAAENEDERNEIRKDLGVLYQSAALFDSMSVYENVAFPLKERMEVASKSEISSKVLQMLKSLSLIQYSNKLPQEVSVGIRKRVGLARALVTSPKILLIDEPNTGLDPRDGQEVYDLIKLCRNMWNLTGIVISHEIPEVFQVSDKVAMLLNGTIKEYGPPEELLSSRAPAVTQFLQGNKNGPIHIE